MPFWRRSERIARQADLWVARLHGTDRAQFAAMAQTWRDADPRHEAAFRRSEALWSATGSATRTRPAPPAYAERTSVVTPRRLAFASVTAIVAAAGGTIAFERLQAPSIERAVQTEIYAQQRSLALADGSLVRLGPNSEVVPHLGGLVRNVTLVRGSARFTVAHDAVHPFVVTAFDRTVTARGTIFDVALRPAGLSVTMIEGVVEVTRRPSASAERAPLIRLRRGDRLIVDRGDERVTPAPTETGAAARNYGATPLSQVIADAARNGAKPIRLGDAQLGALRVQGYLDLSDTGALARQLAAALDLNLSDDGQAFVLTRSPSSK
jgi:transmembrane sensor